MSVTTTRRSVVYEVLVGDCDIVVEGLAWIDLLDGDAVYLSYFGHIEIVIQTLSALSWLVNEGNVA